MSEKALLIAREEILRVLQESNCDMAYEEITVLADQLLELIDWADPALMHKDIEWITKFYLQKSVCA